MHFENNMKNRIDRKKISRSGEKLFNQGYKA